MAANQNSSSPSHMGAPLLVSLKLGNRLSLACPKGSMKLKAISFGLVGVMNTFVDLGVFSVAWMFFGLSPLLANLVAWFLAISGSYFVNCFTTFAAESGRRVALRTYAGFIGAGVAGLMVGTAVLLVAKMFLPVLAAKLLAIVASFAINFSMSHFVVFSSVSR